MYPVCSFCERTVYITTLGEVLGIIFAGYVLLASQRPAIITVYSIDLLKPIIPPLTSYLDLTRGTAWRRALVRKTTNKQSQTDDRNRQIQSNYERVRGIALFVDAM